MYCVHECVCVCVRESVCMCVSSAPSPEEGARA